MNIDLERTKVINQFVRNNNKFKWSILKIKYNRVELVINSTLILIFYA